MGRQVTCQMALVLGLLWITSGFTSEASSCDVTQLTQCLRSGGKFVKKYLRDLQRDPSKHVYIHNKCREFEKFKNCVRGFQACPAFHTKIIEDWEFVLRNLSCACSSGPAAECVKDLKCFENEYNLLPLHCELHYNWSYHHNRQEKCYYLDKRVECSSRIITSACGQRVGEFTHHVTRLLWTRHSYRHSLRCRLPKLTNHHNPTTHQPKCPRNLTNSLDECYYQHLRRGFLKFYEFNDLVARGTKKDFRSGCREFRAYQQCIRPLEESCPHHTEMYFSLDNGQLRTYRQKMEYICTRVRQDYIHNLPCYQRVAESHALISSCTAQWDSVKAILLRTTAHEFYCSNDSAAHRELDRLRNCHEKKVTGECGLPGGAIFNALEEMILQDPLFLKFDYKPHCIPKEFYITTSQPTSQHQSTITEQTSDHRTAVERGWNSVNYTAETNSSNVVTTDSSVVKAGATKLDNRGVKTLSTTTKRAPSSGAINDNELSKTIRSPRKEPRSEESSGAGCRVTLTYVTLCLWCLLAHMVT